MEARRRDRRDSVGLLDPAKRGAAGDGPQVAVVAPTKASAHGREPIELLFHRRIRGRWEGSRADQAAGRVVHVGPLGIAFETKYAASNLPVVTGLCAQNPSYWRDIGAGKGGRHGS